MKQWLLISAAAAVLSVGCSKDKTRTLTPEDLAGRWAPAEVLIDGRVEPVSLAEELSYWEFRTNGTYVEYDYYNNRLYEWEYTLADNVLSTPDGPTMLRWPVTGFTGDAFTLTDGSYSTRFRRSTNRPMLFLEPSVQFGATVAQIKQQERRELLNETTTGLGFRGSNAIEQAAIYILEGGRMTTSGLQLSPATDPKELANFLTASYILLGETEQLLVFRSRDQKYEVILGINPNGILLVFVPATTGSGSKAGAFGTEAETIDRGRQRLEAFKRLAGIE